ncbi:MULTISPECIES: hypothetical protein [Bacillales]|uniref:STAS domain-containing protein n=1 Tax=Lysinibacillus louembei TaxID=1470088 RepID=A0ABZ0S125_9BACI|nr:MULTISPECIES: hypothetical protein [Bacillales]MCT6924788.1 hypothetical protein [Metasolibacillus sp.]MCT6941056.1 hypothetical protein [Metasolibacillus sp.]WPK13282.1 hypothetical protein R6U77_06300 [Lysinibacillus louembei]
MSQGQYSIQVNSAGKVVNMKVSGTFTPEKAQEFINDYNRQIGKISANEYDLRFDCRGLNVVTQEMTPHLEGCFKLYNESGFKNIIIEIDRSAVLKMQLARLGRNVGLTNLKIEEV